MKTRQEFLEFITGLSADDRLVATAVALLLRRADSGGRVARVGWVAAVERALQGGGVLGAGVTDTSDADAEAFRRLINEGVIDRLEGVGMVRREPPTEDWDFMEFDVELWAAMAGEVDTLAEEVETTAHRLSEGRAARAQVVPGAGLVEGGSRFSAEGLTKIYRRRKVVNEASIDVRQGEIVGLLGPNGAGKTTTFYMMVGLIPPNAGKVYLDGDELTGVPMYRRARRGVGYLAQEPSVFRRLTVEENVLAILETLSLNKAQRRARLEELLSELGLSHLRKNKAYSLSGGERRRLEITRALVQRPKFMLLDEPFAGIDPIAVNDIQEIVSELRHRGIGVIISDHNVEQTLEIVDRAYIMYEGRIRVSGTVSELVWNDEVAEIYLGPTLTDRMRQRYERPNVPANAGYSGA
jgi:lipopolysaccharide export system ATP-binding protein